MEITLIYRQMSVFDWTICLSRAQVEVIDDKKGHSN